jgi:hypothetical protein
MLLLGLTLDWSRAVFLATSRSQGGGVSGVRLVLVRMRMLVMHVVMLTLGC